MEIQKTYRTGPGGLERFLRVATASLTTLALTIVVAQQGSAQNQGPDSVVILLRSLQQRLDSLERVITLLRSEQQDTTQAIDELAALRAAARAVTGPTEPVDEVAAAAGNRTSNLQILNPEISVTGDVVGNFYAPTGESGSFSGVPREFEFSFQAALDPYTRTKIFVGRHEDFTIAGAPEVGHGEEADAGGEEADPEEGHGFEIEEGYMYWVGLPGGFGAKVGKFRQEIGLYNRWHTHALLEVEQPLVTSVFLGEEGLAQTGLGVTLPSFTFGPATQTITVEVTRGDNSVLFEGGSQLSYLGRFQNFWDLGAATYLQFGATGVYGKNNDVDLESKLLGFDFSFRWMPPGQALYRDLQLKGEWYFLDQAEGTESRSGDGGYLQANYRLTRRWILGTRVDYINNMLDAPDLLQLVPSLTWWQSEFVRIRLQYNMLRAQSSDANHTVLLQFVWAMGPHKHESY